MSSLESVYAPFHKFPFHTWTANHTPIHSLWDEAQEMLWHQWLIHLVPHTIQESYKHIDGFPNLSKFKFNNLSKCYTCIKANMTNNLPRKRSLTKSVRCPYQDLFIDFGFSGRISKLVNLRIIYKVTLENLRNPTYAVITALNRSNLKPWCWYQFRISKSLLLSL